MGSGHLNFGRGKASGVECEKGSQGKLSEGFTTNSTQTLRAISGGVLGAVRRKQTERNDKRSEWSIFIHKIFPE